MESMNVMARQIHESNKKNGFDTSKENRGQTLMLIVSELGEALEADRKGRFANVAGYNAMKWDTVDEAHPSSVANFRAAFETNIKDTYEDELADAIIRILDHVGADGIDIDTHVKLKRRYNATREYKHGKRY